MKLTLLAAALIGTVAFSGASSESVDPKRLSDIVRVLASDEFEGRSPGTPGETKTVNYLVETFRALGLEPGGEHGGWTQGVPLLRTQLETPRTLQMMVKGQPRPLVQAKDVYLSTVQDAQTAAIDNAPLVFVGYGVTAPERQWDDHFPLARQGVPVILLMALSGAADMREGGRAAGEKWLADYMRCYHQTCDAWDASWDLRGATQDVELFHTIATELANSRRWPQWRPDSEFRSIRERSAKQR